VPVCRSRPDRHWDVLAIALRAGNAGSNTTAVDLIPAPAWTPAYDADGGVRDGAWVAETTGLLDLSRWPPGMRVIVRNERPHPGAQTAGHRPRRAAHHCVRHQRPARPTPGSGAPLCNWPSS
jgi:hypothetical protein